MAIGLGLALATANLAAALSTPLKVPFFHDHTDQCGPSTLAEMLSYCGIPANPAELRQEMYVSKLHGTLPMDLFLTAQNHGLKAQMVHGDAALLQSELNAGRPVLILLNLGYEILPVDHFIVITGFDTERQGFYAHSGEKANQFFPMKKLAREWGKADNWALAAAQCP